MIGVILCFLSVGFSVFYLYLGFQQKNNAALAVKAIASSCFVGAGICWYRSCPDPVLARNVLTGLILGAIADVVLNLRFVFNHSWKKAFFAGAIVFLAGHLFYIAALFPHCPNPALCILAGLLASMCVVYIFNRSARFKKSYKILGVCYITAIFTMAVMAFAVLYSGPTPHSAAFAAGALMFLVSDMLLISHTFKIISGQTVRVIYILLYYIAQCLIAGSLRLGY